MLLPFLVFLKRAYVWLVEYFGDLGFNNGVELGKMIFTPSYLSVTNDIQIEQFQSFKN